MVLFLTSNDKHTKYNFINYQFNTRLILKIREILKTLQTVTFKTFQETISYILQEQYSVRNKNKYNKKRKSPTLFNNKSIQFSLEHMYSIANPTGNLSVY